MLPTIRDGDILQVERVDPATLRVGDIVFFRSGGEFKAHRVIRKRKDFFLTRGDAGLEPETISRGEIVGKIVAKECAKSGCRVVLQGTAPRVKYFSSEIRRAVSRQIGRRDLNSSRALLVPFSLIAGVLLASVGALGQLGGVALDNVNSQGFVTGSAGCTGASPTFTCTFNHTTNSVIGSTGLLIVGVSMNIKNNAPDSSVTAVTYNGTAMTSAANANPGNNLRAQIFYLKNPATGAHAVTLTVNKTGGTGNQIGIEVGAITVYRVSQSFTSLKLVQNNGTSATATAAFTATTGIPGTNDGYWMSSR